MAALAFDQDGLATNLDVEFRRPEDKIGQDRVGDGSQLVGRVPGPRGHVSAATAVVIIAAAILPFVTPQFVAFEQGPIAASSGAVRRANSCYPAAVVVLGVVPLFDGLFAIFHRILLPPGSFTFDSTPERLVQPSP